MGCQTFSGRLVHAKQSAPLYESASCLNADSAGSFGGAGSLMSSIAAAGSDSRPVAWSRDTMYAELLLTVVAPPPAGASPSLVGDKGKSVGSTGSFASPSKVR